MDEKNVIASAISDYELARAFSELVADRWDNWDLSKFLPYLVDTCAPAALPYLADQFDVEGLRGFGIAMDEEQQRDIIKKSIALHKFIGTPWAIREACRTVGFPVILLEENSTPTGSAPSEDDWARFRVLITADTNRHITIEETRKLRLFVEFYKNERSHLIELGYAQSLVEDRLFRPAIKERDTLDIITLAIQPNPAQLDPAGNSLRVTVSASAPWMIEENIFKWDDGTDDKITITFTGTQGDSEITITSDPIRNAARELSIPILSINGRELGHLKVQQVIRWNAYSRAYSNAYNIFPLKINNAYSAAYCRAYNVKPTYSNGYTTAYSRAYNAPKYMKIAPEVMYFSRDAEVQQINIESNTNWELK